MPDDINGAAEHPNSVTVVIPFDLGTWIQPVDTAILPNNSEFNIVFGVFFKCAGYCRRYEFQIVGVNAAEHILPHHPELYWRHNQNNEEIRHRSLFYRGYAVTQFPCSADLWSWEKTCRRHYDLQLQGNYDNSPSGANAIAQLKSADEISFKMG